MKIVKRKSIIVLSYFFICAIFYGVINIFYQNGIIDWGVFEKIVVIPLFFISLFCMKKVGISFFDLPNIVFILCFFLHFGQIVIKTFDPFYKFGYDVLSILKEKEYIQSVLYSLLFLNFYCIGMMLSYCKKNDSNIQTTNAAGKDKNNMKHFAFTTLVLFMPLELYITTKKMIVSFSMGYLGIFNTNINGYIELFAKFHILAIAALMITYRKKKMAVFSIFGCYSIYSIIAMLSGSRMYQLFALSLLWYILVQITDLKLNVKLVVFISIIGILMVTFLNTLASTRNTGVEVLSLANSLNHSWNNNPVFKFFEEIGATLATMGITVNRITSGLLHHSGGLQEIISFIGIFPNIGGKILELVNQTNYVLLLKEDYIGGSIIGEFYYNWGWLAFPFVIATGYIIGNLSKKVNLYLKSNESFKVLFYIMPMYFILQWQRGAFVALPRYFVFSFLFLMLYKKIFVKRWVRR